MNWSERVGWVATAKPVMQPKRWLGRAGALELFNRHIGALLQQLVERPISARGDDFELAPFLDLQTNDSGFPTAPHLRLNEALIKLDMPSIVKMGAHPLVPFLAQLQMQRLRPGRG